MCKFAVILKKAKMGDKIDFEFSGNLCGDPYNFKLMCSAEARATERSGVRVDIAYYSVRAPIDYSFTQQNLELETKGTIGSIDNISTLG
jgi:hypothetical protein